MHPSKTDVRPEPTVRIEGYRDLERVGSGGFSTVWKAYQERFDRIVAVKLLDITLADEAEQARFQRECRTAGRVSRHPHIVTVLDSGITTDGHPFIVSEYMHQGSLGDRCLADGPLPLAQVLAAGVKVCGALAAVHDAGIQHRDVKPENVLVSEYGEPALADFGISAVRDHAEPRPDGDDAPADGDADDADLGPVRSYYMKFTPTHTPPELLDGKPASAASDVYSLGSTLYTLLAGRPPFEGGDDGDLLPLLRRILCDPVPDPGDGSVPPDLLRVLRTAMAKEPAERYTSALFGDALQDVERAHGLVPTGMVTRLNHLDQDAGELLADDDRRRGVAGPIVTSGSLGGVSLGSAALGGAALAAGPRRADGDDGDGAEETKRDRTRDIALVVIIALLALLAGMLLWRPGVSDQASPNGGPGILIDGEEAEGSGSGAANGSRADGAVAVDTDGDGDVDAQDAPPGTAADGSPIGDGGPPATDADGNPVPTSARDGSTSSGGQTPATNPDGSPRPTTASTTAGGNTNTPTTSGSGGGGVASPTTTRPASPTTTSGPAVIPPTTATPLPANLMADRGNGTVALLGGKFVVTVTNHGQTTGHYRITPPSGWGAAVEGDLVGGQSRTISIAKPLLAVLGTVQGDMTGPSGNVHYAWLTAL